MSSPSQEAQCLDMGALHAPSTLAVAVAVTMLTAAAAAAPQDQNQHQAEYYVSLGDSLSAGVQPDASGQSLPTNDGFTDQLYALLRPHHPGLMVHKLGLPG